MLIRMTVAERDELLAVSRSDDDPDRFGFEAIAWFGSYTIRVTPAHVYDVLAALPEGSTLAAKIRAVA